MRIKTILLIVSLLCLAFNVSAQVPALYQATTKRIFIKGPDSSCVMLFFYVGEYKARAIPIKYVLPFSISDNISEVKSGRKHMVIDIYNTKLDAFLKNDLKKMTIDLEFQDLPDTVNYYLQIPFIIPGRKIRVIVRNNYHRDITAESCCDRFIYACRPNLTNLIDISSLVFPAH